MTDTLDLGNEITREIITRLSELDAVWFTAMQLSWLVAGDDAGYRQTVRQTLKLLAVHHLIERLFVTDRYGSQPCFRIEPTMLTALLSTNEK